MNTKNHKLSLRSIAYSLLCLATIFVLAGCSTIDQLAQPLPVSLPARFTNTPLAVGSKTYPVQSGRVVRTVEFAGLVRANTQHDLYFPVSGGVAEVFVKNGAQVLPGDLIAELESDDAKMDLADAEIALQLAALTLEQTKRDISADQESARLELDAKQLELDRLIIATRAPAYDLEMAEHDVRVAQAVLDQANLRNTDLEEKQIEAAQSRLTRAQLEVDRLMLRAPVTGTVRLGPQLRVGQGVDSYTVVGRVVDSSMLIVESDVPPADMELLATATPVQINVTSLAGSTFLGKIIALPQPYGISSTPFVQIAPEGNQADLDLREGSSMVVRVEMTTSQDVIMLPNDAIQTVAGRTYVVVREADFLRDQEISIGLKGDMYTQIVDGLSEGMQIVAP